MTYSIDICWQDMPVKYKGLRLTSSKSALNELMKYGFDLEDCKEILELGYHGRKRSKNKIEKWLDRRDKTFNIVIAKDFHEIMKEEVWVIIHLGKFTKK